MLKRMSAVSAAVAGALLMIGGTGAQAAEGQLICDRPLSSRTPANCVWQSQNMPAERVSVVTSGSGEPVVSRGSAPASAPAVVSGSERVLIVSEPTSAGAPVYIIEPAPGSRIQRGDQVVIVTQPAESARVIESSRGDAFPDPSPPSAIVEPRRSDRYDRNLDPSDTRDRALGRHSQPQ